MSAANVYSSHFTSAGVPVAPRPFMETPGFDSVSVTIATTSLDDVNDFVGFLAIPAGKTLSHIERKSPDMDSGGPTLDIDIVLRRYNSSDTATDTTLYDAGTAPNTQFSTAVSGELIVCNTFVVGDARDYAILGLKVIAAATTPASGVVQLAAYWK